MPRTSFLIACLLAGGCAQLLGLEEPNGPAGPDDGSIDDPRGDATPPGPVPDAKVDLPHDSGPPGGDCVTLPRFGAPTNYGVTGPLLLAVGDLDHDGFPDVAVTRPGGFTIYHGTGGGVLGRVQELPLADGDPISLRIADLDADGFDDLVWSGGNKVGVLRQKPSPQGSFLADQLIAGAQFTGTIGVGELSGGGPVDLLLTGASGPQVFVGHAGSPGVFDPGPGFSLGAGGAQLLTVSQIDGDGRDDAAFVVGSFVKIVRQQASPAGSFAPPMVASPLMPMGDGAAFGRIDDDSLVDLVIDAPTGHWLRQNPAADASFSEVGTVPVSGMSTRIADVNGDGRGDVLAMNQIAVQCALPQAAGSFSPTTVSLAAATPATLVDLSGDGKLDALALNPGQGFLVVQLQVLP